MDAREGNYSIPRSHHHHHRPQLSPEKKAYKHIYEEHVHKHRQLSGREAEDYDVRIVWIFADF